MIEAVTFYQYDLGLKKKKKVVLPRGNITKVPVHPAMLSSLLRPFFHMMGGNSFQPFRPTCLHGTFIGSCCVGEGKGKGRS